LKSIKTDWLKNKRNCYRCALPGHAIDSKRTYYYFKDDQFIIDRVEDRHEEIGNDNQTGAIN